MNKLNKKGFTLIEMLVVIAIIAILVAIIIPTIGSATDKAAAATNAANLRSYKAELTTALLTGEMTKPTNTGAVSPSVSGVTAPTPKAVGNVTESSTLHVRYDKTTNSFEVAFDDHTIDDFAKVADGTNKADAMASSRTK